MGIITCFILLPFIATNCGGGGSSPGAESDSEASSTNINLNVVLGPIVGATIRVAPLNDRTNILFSGVTEDADDIGTAGSVPLSIPLQYSNVPLYITANGGADIDADDDGIRDDEPTENNTLLEFAVPNSDDLENFRIVANPLLKFASKYALAQVDKVTDITSENVRTILRRVAKALIVADIDGDNLIDWTDITSFHPLFDKEKSRIPWDYLLEDIRRERQQYYANLDISYSRTFNMDQHTYEPVDEDSDGDWRNDYGSSFDLYFSTNKNGYTMRDIIDGMGLRGGTVTLPDDATFSYVWYHCDESGNSISETVIDDPTPPLFLQCMPSDDDMDLSVFSLVGGGVIDPEIVPVGEYSIEYHTGDGLDHQEILYVHENTSDSYLLVYPELKTDENGFLENIRLRFQSTTGEILEDPPILDGSIYVQLREPVETMNDLVRGEGFYKELPDDPAGWYIFVDSLDIFSSTIEFYPQNNGHLIYAEDLGSIDLPIYTGDGVQRSFNFSFQ